MKKYLLGIISLIVLGIWACINFWVIKRLFPCLTLTIIQRGIADKEAFWTIATVNAVLLFTILISLNFLTFNKTKIGIKCKDWWIRNMEAMCGTISDNNRQD